MTDTLLITDYKLVDEIDNLGYLIEDSTGVKNLLVKRCTNDSEVNGLKLIGIENEYKLKYGNDIAHAYYFEPAKVQKVQDDHLSRLRRYNDNSIIELIKNLDTSKVIPDELLFYFSTMESLYGRPGEACDYILSMYPSINAGSKASRPINLINAQVIDNQTIKINNEQNEQFRLAARYNLKSKIVGGPSSNISQFGNMISTRLGLVYNIKTGVDYVGYLIGHRYNKLHCNKLIIPSNGKIVRSTDMMYNSINVLDIQCGVMVIQKRLFCNADIKKINFGNTICIIEEMAFKNCGIEHLELPKNIREIKQEAFSNNDKLKTIKFTGTNLRLIGIRAFANCPLIESVKLPDGLQVIQENAFSDCASLKEIVIPDSVEYISSYAFSGCPVSYIKFPESWIPSYRLPFELDNRLPELTINISAQAADRMNRIIDTYNKDNPRMSRKIHIEINNYTK